MSRLCNAGIYEQARVIFSGNGERPKYYADHRLPNYELANEREHMARLIPTDPGMAAASAGERSEHETLRSLGAALSDSYTIFHGVRWADESDRATPVGELDFVIVNQSGAVLLVEQKAGQVSETRNGLVKNYGDNIKPVATQVHRSFDHIKHKWGQSNPSAGPIDVGYLLYLPDHAVMDINAALRGLSLSRIQRASVILDHRLFPGARRIYWLVRSFRTPVLAFLTISCSTFIEVRVSGVFYLAFSPSFPGRLNVI